MKEKIYNFLINARCIKKEIKHNNKEFNVYIIKDSYARSIFPKNIVVDDRFFDEYNKQEQIAIFYHENYHSKFFTLIRRPFLLLKFLSFKKSRWQEEFDADEFATKNIGKTFVISFLEKSKKFYKNGNIKYNPKTHPTIEERIKRIKELK